MSDDGDLLAKFFGYALKAIGFLIMLVSGLCSGFGLMFVMEQPSMLAAVLFFGGIPFAVGWLCWWAGSAVMPKKQFAPRHSVRDDPQPEPPPDPTSDPP